MPTPAPLSPGKGTALMIYGLPGSGKTRLLATGGRVLIIHPPTDHTDSIPPPAAGVEEVTVDDWSGMLEIQQWIQQEGHKKYDWIWLDSISLMQDYLLDDVLQDAIMRKPTRGMQKGGVTIPEFGSDVGEYKINFERIRKWVGDMVGFSKSGLFNFGLTAHPFEWWDPVREEDLWSPWIQGKNMSPKICGYMNIVAYLQANEEENKTRQEVLTVDADGFVGKDQFNCFPKLKSGRHGFVNPTMSDIEAVIKSKRPKPAATRKKATRKPARRRKS